MSLDQRFYFIAIAFFVTTIVVKGSSGLIVPPRPSTNDDSAKKLNQISASDQLPETGSFLYRKAHGRYQRDQSEQVELQIYKADVETQTVSMRLTPLDLVLDGVDSFNVQIVNDERVVYYQNRFAVSQELNCKLWNNAICLQNLSIASISEWNVLGSKIKVSGEKNGLKVTGKQWESNLRLNLPRRDPSSPIGLAITYPSPGVVKFQWKHPSFPDSKIPRFHVRLRTVVDHPGVLEQEDNEKEPQLHPSRRRHFEIVAKNQRWFGTPEKFDFLTPDRIDFEIPQILSIGPNGTWVKFQVPAVINATVDTWVNVTVEGPLNCTNISEDRVQDSESSCYLEPGRSYVIKAEGKDKVTNVSAVPIKSMKITLPDDDGEASPNVREEPNLNPRYEVKSI